MKKELVDILQDLSLQIGKQYVGKKNDKFQNDIARLVEKYKVLETQERHQETYVSLMKRGRELQKAANLKDEKKLEYFLRYCHAAYYDFTDNLKPLNWLMRAFMTTVMFFYIMAPMYYGYILPLIMVVPVFIGMRGMKKRSLNGLITGCAVLPMGVMVGVTHLKMMALATSAGYGEYIAKQGAMFGLSADAAASLMNAFNIVSLLLVASGSYGLFLAFKHNKMFL